MQKMGARKLTVQTVPAGKPFSMTEAQGVFVRKGPSIYPAEKNEIGSWVPAVKPGEVGFLAKQFEGRDIELI